jgi:hypothetical protein
VSITGWDFTKSGAFSIKKIKFYIIMDESRKELEGL